MAWDLQNMTLPQKIVLFGGGGLVAFFALRAIILHSAGQSTSSATDQATQAQMIDAGQIEQNLGDYVTGAVGQAQASFSQTLAQAQTQQMQAVQQLLQANQQQTLQGVQQLLDQHQVNPTPPVYTTPAPTNPVQPAPVTGPSIPPTPVGTLMSGGSITVTPAAIQSPAPADTSHVVTNMTSAVSKANSNVTTNVVGYQPTNKWSNVNGTYFVADKTGKVVQTFTGSNALYNAINTAKKIGGKSLEYALPGQ